MKLTIDIPGEDFVNPEMTPQEQVEHLFKLHNIRATVTPVEPSFREVMEWLKKCGWFQKILNIDKILELFKKENDK